jgi:hypothetical protein
MRPSSLVPHNSGHGNEFGNPGRPSSKGRGLPYSENCPICDQGKETIKVMFISAYNLARLYNLNDYQTVQLINQII